MNPIAIKYPLDLTGISPNNLVINEPQTLLNNPNRAIVPNYGPYYTDGLIIIDQATGQPLQKITQYVAAQLHQDLSLETGKQICQVIVITDPSVSNNILLTYQVVGGEYAYSTDALIQMLAALQIDDRSVTWGQILGLPSEFPPTEHLHDIGDTYGWEYVVAALESMRQAVLTGDDAARQNMLNYINAAVAQMNTTVAGFNSLLTAHTGNLANPHSVTAAQLNLGNVMNYGIASQADVAAATSNTLYVTPYAMAGVAATLNSGLAAHVANQSNPHHVTAAQVNLGSVFNAGFGTNADAVAGTSAIVYMNPALTKAAITAQAYTPLNTALNTHISNHNNPHAVTAAQVNLGNVPNVGYATLTEAKAGTGNNLMSGSLTGQAIATLALSPLNTHIANHANPHAVTAAQTGAYTYAQIDSKVSTLNAAIAARQTNLGFTPVQQGGGGGQGTNKIYIGWDSPVVTLQVDATPKGAICFAGSGGYVTDGIYHQAYSTLGYVRFPNGFILQWSFYEAYTGWVEGATGGQTFALAFPNACLGVSQSKAFLDPSGVGVSLYDDDARVYNLSKTGFSFYINWPGSSTANHWPGFYWMAWGY